jgi:replicative DNA helicase
MAKPNKKSEDFKEIKNLNEEIYEGRVPPHSKEIEMNLLAGMLFDNKSIDLVLSKLESKHFYFASHARIYKAMTDLRDKNEPVDLVTLTETLKSRDELDEVGGPITLAEIAASFFNPENIMYSVEKILEYWIKRQIIEIAYSIRGKGFDPTSDVENLLNEAQREILDVTNYMQKKSYTHIRDEVKTTLEYVEGIHERHAKGITVFGVPSGYAELDILTGGFQKSELIIIAGRPSHGKTALALNIARNAAVDNQRKIGIFSIEMSNRELALRFLCLEARVDIAKLKTGRLPDSDWDKITRNFNKLTRPETTIIIDDSSPLSLLELRAKSRRMKATYDIDMIIVDYLQLMEVSNLRKTDNRYLEIGYITRGLKELSKELNIPVVALSQLSRKVEDRSGREKRPQLSDLRESGSIEQDADVVIFINRPEVYMSKDDPKFDEVHGLAEIIVGKQRNGPIGDAKLTFIHNYAKFEDRTNVPIPQYHTSEETPF